MSGSGLLKDLEQLFENSEQRVLAAFVVSGGGSHRQWRQRLQRALHPVVGAASDLIPCPLAACCRRPNAIRRHRVHGGAGPCPRYPSAHQSSVCRSCCRCRRRSRLPACLPACAAVHRQVAHHLPDRQAAQQEAGVQGHAAHPQAGAGAVPGKPARLRPTCDYSRCLPCRPADSANSGPHASHRLVMMVTSPMARQHRRRRLPSMWPLF